jgi:hypothetical protein
MQASLVNGILAPGLRVRFEPPARPARWIRAGRSPRPWRDTTVGYTFAGFLVLLLVPLLFGAVDVAAASAAGLVLVLLLGGVSVAAFVDQRDLRQQKRGPE